MRWRRQVRVAFAAVAAAAFSGCSWLGPGAAVVQVLSPALPKRLDPYRDSRFVSQNVFLNVFEPLVDTDPQDRLVPALAESWTSPDPNLYLFRLREGVVFHDGTPLRAEAVVEAFLRARRDGHFVAAALAEVQAIEARDERTVALHTGRPVPDLVLALRNVPVTRPGRLPDVQLGTGPYEVAEFEPGESLRLRRFERYYGARPFIREATYRRFADPAAALRLIDAERQTLVVDPPPALVEQLAGRPGLEVTRQPGAALTYLAFDLRPRSGTSRPFLDRRVRTALSLALDRQALMASGATLGSGVIANQLVPPGVFGFDPALPPARRDAERARALLAEAGYAAGFEAVLDTTPAYERAAGQLVKQLAAVGLRVQVRTLASDDFVTHIEKGSDFYLYSWVLGLESGEALRSFLHSKDPARGFGLRNRTGYSHPEVDALLETALSAALPDERLQPLRRAMDLVMQDLPWVPLFVADTARICPRGLSLPTRTDGYLVLAQLRPR